MPRRFPDQFLFGAATSAHQVEGWNVHNDWWAWEHSPERLAALKRLGRDPKQFQSGRACEHAIRFREDFTLAQALGQNAHRFSIEWSRIEPTEGSWDEEAIEHYRQVLLALRERGITPIVTLHHFTNPLWFARRGGFANPDAVNVFTRYVARIAEALGALIPYWVTINEPSALAAQGYLIGAWPPQRRNPLLARRVIEGLAAAHRSAYRVLKSSGASAVGIAYSCRAWLPFRPRRSDRIAAKIAERLTWEWFLDRIRNDLDFIGVNYYFANRIRAQLRKPVLRGCNAETRSDLGWDICPDGLRIVLEHLSRRYGKPLIVTENGIADADDSRRSRFLFDHLVAVHEAMSAGADVRGYLYWSLLDNFEWAEGFAPRFGLIAVDYETMERRVRPSARFYAHICRTKMLPDAHERREACGSAEGEKEQDEQDRDATAGKV